VSILPVISKKFERAINDQIVFYSNKIVHPYISAFRSGYGCETALLKIIEERIVFYLIDSFVLNLELILRYHNILIFEIRGHGGDSQKS
jgi:hypothetical protein